MPLADWGGGAQAGATALEETVVAMNKSGYAGWQVAKQQVNRERSRSRATGEDSIPKASGKECSMHETSGCRAGVACRWTSVCTHVARVGTATVERWPVGPPVRPWHAAS